jgi:SagB-type dehydrogenase family enzyme
MLRYDDAYSLAALFHRNSEPWGNQAAYDDPHARAMAFKTTGTRETSIPLPATEGSPLERLITARHSCRGFAETEIELHELGALLETAYGITGIREWPGSQRAFGRTVPSGGGRYPLELYVLSNRVHGLDRGVHHFNVRDHALEPLAMACSIGDLVPDLMHQVYLQSASALVIMTAVFPRMLDKYGARGYRYVLMECGHAAQNLCLRAVELGLGTLCVGGFTDHRINALLELDPVTEGALYGVAIGRAGTT